MKKIIFILGLVYICLSTGNYFAQTGEIKVGASTNNFRYNQGAFFDYSDPEAINITVSVWGYVRYPGKYLVPNYSTVKDLLSYSGGPTQDAHLDDLRLYKVSKDSSKQLLKFDYDDLLWGEQLSSNKESLPNLGVGDILVVPGSPRYFFRDNFNMTLSIISALTSLTILVLNIVKK